MDITKVVKAQQWDRKLHYSAQVCNTLILNLLFTFVSFLWFAHFILLMHKGVKLFLLMTILLQFYQSLMSSGHNSAMDMLE